MKTNFDRMRESLELRAGIRKPEPAPFAGWTLERFIEENTSKEFREKTALCLAMGTMRYGPLKTQRKPVCWNVHQAIERLARFLDDGNEQHLIDSANMCEAEWVMKSHPKAHFRPLDRD
jgi:hypothetical protein